MTAYIDPSTIRKDGNMRKVWAIQDFRSKAPRGELSRRALQEYDCKEERSRLLSLETFSGNMATGVSLYLDSSANGSWNYLPPGSIGTAALKAVCG